MEETNAIVLDRTTYKKIKSMDRKQMEQCLSNIYKSGINDASGEDNGNSAEAVENTETAANAVTAESIRNAISTVKGIGEARLNDIMQAVEKLYAVQ